MTAITTRRHNPPARVDAAPADGPLRHYHALDMLRGFAALVVCIYHVSFLFTDRTKLFASGFLCVDLFFILSGFVIAANYDRKIAQGMTLRRFTVDRLARLYPLFFVTMLAGLCAISAQQFSKAGWTDAARPLLTLLANAFMIPSFFSPWGSVSVFPLNGPSWSIFFELWVNIFFFLVWRLIEGRRLIVLVAIAVVALVVSGFANAGLDSGWGQHNLGHGFIRVLFSFFMGVWIYRSGVAECWRLGGWPTSFALAALLAILSIRGLAPDSWGAAADLVTVLAVFPPIVVLLAASRLSPGAARFAAVFGGISYSVYLLQTPMVILASGLPPVLTGEKVAAYAPWAGFAFVPLLLCISYVTWRWYEVPAKNWLRRWQRRRMGLSSSI